MKALVFSLAVFSAAALAGSAGAAGAAGAAGTAVPAAAPAASPQTSTTKPDTGKPAKPNTNKPITVNSDSLSADIGTSIGIYTGHVVITQDTLKMRADEVKVFATGGKPSRLEARGNIVVDSPSGSAIGDFGTYDINSHLITLTGNDVVLSKDQNVMHGDKLEVHTDTNVARLFQNRGQVHGLFVQPPKAAGASAKPKPPAGNTKPKQPAGAKAGGAVKP